MPWTIERRQDEWCVINPDGSKAGCHATRERALRQQRALYAQESATASAQNGDPPVRVEFAPAEQSLETEKALLASIDQITETLGQVVEALGKVVEIQNTDRAALTEALTAAANQPEPVVNVYVPELVIPEQPPATVNVHVPKSQILVPQGPTPVVNVSLPGTKKTVTFTRNLNGEVEQADIVEEPDV